MSVRAVSWAIDQAPVGGNTTARMILVSLADRADENGRDAYKYVSAIADSIRKSDSTVSRTLAWMEEIGVIERGNQHLVDSYPWYARPVVYDLRLDLVQEPTPRQVKKGRPGRPRKIVKDPQPNSGKAFTGTEIRAKSEEKASEVNDCNENEILCEKKTGAPEKPARKENPVSSVRPPRSYRCDHPGPTGALHNVQKHPKTYNPSLPTGELPASGKRHTGEDGKNETGQASEAVTVMDHLTAIRSKLSLTTSTPTKRDYAKIGNLVSRVAKAHDGDHAAAVALILAVIDWLPANTYWLRRIDSARRLADNWDQIANDWTVSQLENQRERDTEARTRDRKPVSKPTPIPDHHSERHVHTFRCEHVLNDMKPHEAEYDHEGSLRSGHPSEWQLACMRHADELNQRDGLDKAA